MKSLLLILVVLYSVLVACSSSPTPDVAATVQAAVAATQTAQPTNTPIPTPTVTKRVDAPTFKQARCTFEIPKGADVDCGFVTVPEDRNGDPANAIQIAVAIYHRADGSSASEPVVYLQGGPGSSAVNWIPGFYEGFVAPITAKHDLIVFDQRGVGLSKPALDCPELTSTYLDELKQGMSNEMRTPRYSTALLACRDRLQEQGVDLAAYTTRASAADVHDLITALGYQQVNLYGTSYGGRLALTIMRDYPEMVRAAVLDSPVPLETRIYNDAAANAESALNVLFEHCAAEPACNAAYPHLETTFYDLVDRLNTKPITAEVTNPLNGQLYEITVGGVGLINGVIWGLSSSEYLPLVPQAISDISQGDYTVLSYYAALPLATYSDVSLGLQASIDCHEQIFATTPQEIEDSFAAHPRTKAYGLSAVYGSPSTPFGICKTWGAAPFDPADNQRLHSAIPTLIIAGEYDPTTPPAYSRQIAQNLSHSYLFEFPGQGHTPSINAAPQCPLEMALEFLADPATRPDSACLKAMTDVPFIMPLKDGRDIQLEPFTNTEYGIKGLRPSGWEAAEYNHYNRQRTILDLTQLGIQADRISTQQWLTWLMDHFAQRGLKAAPQFVREYKVNGLTWKFYVAEYEERPVDLAFAETSGRTLGVLLTSDPHDHQVLYDAVFLPVINSVVPIK
jgi:pimeloyl-ACP methyl ester carboxylesterase